MRAYTAGYFWTDSILCKRDVPILPARGEPLEQFFFAGLGLEVSLGRYFQDGYIQSLIRYDPFELGIFLLNSP